MRRRVAVAVVGAGSAGMAAVAEVRKATDDFLLIDDGPLGTMCARSGCMPSKTLIQVANERHLRGRPAGRGLGGGAAPIDVPECLAYVRRLRDGFLAGGIQETRRLGRRLLRGRAAFTGPGELRVGKDSVFAERVVLATGSSPVVPDDMLALGERVVTTDALFDLEDLPRRIGVVGLGAIGLELGQALSRLGCDVTAFDRVAALGRLTDPAVIARAVGIFSKEFPLRFGGGVRVRRTPRGVRISARGRDALADLVLASLGRKPRLAELGLEAAGVRLGKDGVPAYDPQTMKVVGHPIFVAGDASARRPLLHEAVDDGRVAGANSVRRTPRRFERPVPLAVTFTDPNIALVGRSREELAGRRFVVGARDFGTQARALILGRNAGLLHVYAGASDGEFLGAEMVGPAGEHLAHLMALALSRGLTVFEMLETPFYHPTVEEGLRDALRDAAGKVSRRGGRRRRAGRAARPGRRRARGS